MFKKTLLTTIISGMALSANAAKVNENTDIGFYGNINYTIIGDHVDDSDDLKDTYFNFYTRYQSKEHIFMNLNVGGKNRPEFLDLEASEWDFNINALNFEYHEYETNTYAVIGRQYTPIGINYEDPMKTDALFSTENQFSSVIDGLNVVYDNTIEGVDIKASAFIGTRLDDVIVTTSYGGNLKAGNNMFGHFNFGYMNVAIDGNFDLDDSSIIKDNVDLVNLGYEYDNYNVVALIDYNTLTYKDSINDIIQLKAKAGYRIGSLLPYGVYEQYSTGEESTLHDNDLVRFGSGVEYAFPKILTFGAEIGYEDLEDKDEMTLNIFAKMNF